MDALTGVGRSTSPSSGKGNTVSTEGLWEQLRARRLRLQAARGLGHHPGGHRRVVWGVAPGGRRTGGHPHGHAQRGRLSRVDAGSHCGDGRSTRTTPRVPGGGHAPDIIRVAGFANVLPSSTNTEPAPTTRNTLDEHLDMLMVCHHLNPSSGRGPRLRGVADPPVDDGGRGPSCTTWGRSSMIGSDSQAMGRIGETGDPHLADRPTVMKTAPRILARGRCGGQSAARRYVREVHDRSGRDARAGRRDRFRSEVGKLAGPCPVGARRSSRSGRIWS